MIEFSRHSFYRFRSSSLSLIGAFSAAFLFFFCIAKYFLLSNLKHDRTQTEQQLCIRSGSSAFIFRFSFSSTQEGNEMKQKDRSSLSLPTSGVKMKHSLRLCTKKTGNPSARKFSWSSRVFIPVLVLFRSITPERCFTHRDDIVARLSLCLFLAALSNARLSGCAC